MVDQEAPVVEYAQRYTFRQLVCMQFFNFCFQESEYIIWIFSAPQQDNPFGRSYLIEILCRYGIPKNAGGGRRSNFHAGNVANKDRHTVYRSEYNIFNIAFAFDSPQSSHCKSLTSPFNDGPPRVLIVSLDGIHNAREREVVFAELIGSDEYVELLHRSTECCYICDARHLKQERTDHPILQVAQLHGGEGRRGLHNVAVYFAYRCSQWGQFRNNSGG